LEENKAVLTGEHFMNGDNAAAEGGLAARCRFFGGYPITPATEVAERMSERLPEVGGTYIQMEDEIASMNSLLGAAWAGAKTMSSTSGPGFSLMMENLGLGIMLETPCVLVNVQRGGPSTGLPTLVGQADMMQARWGSHGDYEIIALTPNSPQECFDFTIKAFNLSEQYRTPVFVMTDECFVANTWVTAGITLEALYRYYYLTGDDRVMEAMLKSIDWLLRKGRDSITGQWYQQLLYAVEAPRELILRKGVVRVENTAFLALGLARGAGLRKDSRIRRISRQVLEQGFKMLMKEPPASPGRALSVVLRCAPQVILAAD